MFELSTLGLLIASTVCLAQETETAPVALGSIELTISEPISKGQLRVALHRTKETFESLGPPAFGQVFSPGEAVRIDGVAPGTYALIVHHDEDSDGELARNFLKIPTEPLGFAGNYRPSGRPSFERTRLTIQDGVTTTERIELQRFLGDNGLIGVGLGTILQGLPYRGASGVQVTPIPVVTFITDRLAIIGPRLQYSFARLGPTRLSATLRARFPAYDEDDAEILRGLGDRDTLLLGGVQLDIGIVSDVSLRMTYEQDLFDTVGGGEGTAALRIPFEYSSVNFTPSIGVRWVSRDLVRHDFGVPLADAIPGRPAYRPSGSLYAEANLATQTQLTDRVRLVVNLTAQFFDDEVTDSPIVDDDQRISAILGLVYSF